MFPTCYSYESWSLDLFFKIRIHRLSFWEKCEHPLPDRHQKISLTHKSIHDLSLLNFFHISRNVLLLLPPYFFLLLLTVREKNRKIFTEFYIYIKGSNKFSVQGVKEDLENIKI